MALTPNWKDILSSKKDGEREQALDQLRRHLTTRLSVTDKLQLEGSVSTLIGSSAWEKKLGGLRAAVELLPNSSQQFSESLTSEIYELLEHEETRVRFAAGDLLQHLCRHCGTSVYKDMQTILLAKIRDNTSVEVWSPSVSVDSKALLLPSAFMSPSNGAQEFSFSSGSSGDFLRTYLHALRCAVVGCGAYFDECVTSDLLQVIIKATKHSDTAARETAKQILLTIVPGVSPADPEAQPLAMAVSSCASCSAGHVMLSSPTPVRFPSRPSPKGMFQDGTVVVLQSKASGKMLRIDRGRVDGKGWTGLDAQFVVCVRKQPDIVALQSLQTSRLWLTVKNNWTTVTENVGVYCEFKVEDLEGRFVTLESVKQPGCFVGVYGNGTIKPPSQTTADACGQFVPSIQRLPEIIGQTVSLQDMFAEGNVVILQSKASGKSLRIDKGKVQGWGWRDVHAQFIVHVRKIEPRVVALRNVCNTDWWLSVHQGTTLGTGEGGKFSEFLVGEVDDKYITLESVKYPGQHIGIYDTGYLKPPNKTGKGINGQFIPFIFKLAATPSMLSVQLPTLQSHLLANRYNPMDAFHSGNVVRMKARSNDKPLGVRTTELKADDRLEYTETLFSVVVPFAAKEGVITLQNVNWGGLYIGIKGGKIIGCVSQPDLVEKGEGRDFCHFRAHIYSEKYVYFESVKCPRQYLAINERGFPGDPKTARPGDKITHFYLTEVSGSIADSYQSWQPQPTV